MAELRQNPVTGGWVALAPGRSGRPVESQGPEESPESAGRASAPERDPECPFCPGNEARLPEILWERADPADPGWLCRAVPNRYPAFTGGTGPPDAAREPRLLGRDEPEGAVSPGRSFPAVGRQEVLIESARHDVRPERMSPPELQAALDLYRRRLEATTGEAPELFPSLFRNQGAGAGASLLHPHAQLVATRAAGPTRRIREERLVRYRRESGDCLLCRLVDLEPGGRRRVVEEDAHHRAYVPWAPERPLEVWLLPRRHRASFADVDSDELQSLAGVLGRTLRRIAALAAEPDYNYIVHTSAGARAADPALHWFVRIRPITARTAGFELDTGIVVNPSDPIDDAERLRTAGNVDTPGGEA